MSVIDVRIVPKTETKMRNECRKQDVQERPSRGLLTKAQGKRYENDAWNETEKIIRNISKSKDKNNIDIGKLWHEKLGHISINKLIERNISKIINKKFKWDEEKCACSACIQGKPKNKQYFP